MEKYKIEGMTCNHCRGRVEKALKVLDNSAVVDLETETATVSSSVEANKVKEAVEAVGYHVI